MENRGYKGWGIKKLDNRPVRVLMKDCSDPKLFAKCYNMFIGGYTEQEVATHMGVTENEVERAIQHTRSCLSSRTIIGHNNDRHRILVQRTQSEKYRRLLDESLSTPIETYLSAGIGPAGVLREYRDAVGMTEKPGAMSVQMNQQINMVGNSTITSSEDLLRHVMAKLNKDEPVTAETGQGAAPAEPEASDEPDRIV